MRNLILTKKTKALKGAIELTASKSESNRALIITALCGNAVKINNLAKAEDTQTLQRLLDSKEETLDVGPAGTTMRFLTAFYALQRGTRVLTGSQRMKERPIAVLVNALRELGADISYLGEDGYPPLKIKGRPLKGGEITIEGSISSQYLTALLLIAPVLENGLVLNIKGKLSSRPYIKMTVEMMNYFGAQVNWNNSRIGVSAGNYSPKEITIEADWSAASYWYEMAAFTDDVDLTLTGLKKESLQGDAVVADIFKNFGVETAYGDNEIHLKKSANQQISKSTNLIYDFTDCPDIAQTVAVTMAGLNITGTLTGLHSLKIKETDRITALKNELEKTGCKVEADENSICVQKTSGFKPKTVNFSTYHDHRMAMAFAPLAFILPEVIIENPEVVNKSYPGFWDDLKQAGFVATNGEG